MTVLSGSSIRIRVNNPQSAGSGTLLPQFRIRWSTDATFTVFTPLEQTGSADFVLTGLIPGVRVYATGSVYNTVGPSQFGPISSAVPDEAPAPPVAVVTIPDCGSLAVAARQPLVNSGTALTGKMQVRWQASNGSGAVQFRTVSSSFSTIISGLDFGVSYDISVAVENGAGFSAFGPSVTASSSSFTSVSSLSLSLASCSFHSLLVA